VASRGVIDSVLALGLSDCDGYLQPQADACVARSLISPKHESNDLEEHSKETNNHRHNDV
jgi:hypothetical protein